MEKISTPFFNIFGIFMYYLLYANITMITADFAASSRLTLDQEYQKIITKMKQSKLPDNVIKSTEAYR